jgi:SAM-dependent methyltransferase
MTPSALEILEPGLHSIGYSVRRFYVDSFCADQVGVLPSNSLVLDLGGLKTGKRGRFDIGAYPVRVVCLNIVRDRRPDVQADAAAVPFAAGSFDAVICAEVLEHVPDPRPVLGEAFRALKAGGRLLATAPFLYRLHGDPCDFARYTPEFWHRALATAGFDPVTVYQQGRLPSVLADVAKQWVAEGGVPRPFGRLAARAAYEFARWAIRRDSQERRPADAFQGTFATGFGILAMKARARA